jgi:hypothetical protein
VISSDMATDMEHLDHNADRQASFEQEYIGRHLDIVTNVPMMSPCRIELQRTETFRSEPTKVKEAQTVFTPTYQVRAGMHRPSSSY